MDALRAVRLIAVLAVLLVAPARAGERAPAMVWEGANPAGACVGERRAITATGQTYCCTGGSWAACGPTWGTVTGKPSTFPPSTHQHAAGDVTAGTLPQARGGTGAGTLTCSSGQAITSNGTAYSCTSTIDASSVAWGEVTGAPSTFPPSSHQHATGDVTSGTLGQARGGTGAGALTCAAGQHLTSNGTAYSCSADTTYTLPDATSATTGGIRLTGALGGTATSPTVASAPWSVLTGVPTTFAPSAHQHAAGDVTNGTLAGARGGLGAAQPTCTGTQKLTCNGTSCSCAADQDTVYTHPATHPPSIIAQDASNRFVTDTEKATWNSKAAGTHTHPGSDVTSAVATATNAVTAVSAVSASQDYATGQALIHAGNIGAQSVNYAAGAGSANTSVYASRDTATGQVLIHAGNIGSQSVSYASSAGSASSATNANYASSAGSVAWSGVTGKPTEWETGTRYSAASQVLNVTDQWVVLFIFSLDPSTLYQFDCVVSPYCGANGELHELEAQFLFSQAPTLFSGNRVGTATGSTTTNTAISNTNAMVVCQDSATCIHRMQILVKTGAATTVTFQERLRASGITAGINFTGDSTCLVRTMP